MEPFRPDSSCVALVSDMIFATRISGTARQLGRPCHVVRTIEDLGRAIRDTSPGLALIDLNMDGVSGVDAIRHVQATSTSCAIVAFVSHVDRELAEAARAAGAEVLPRSRFVQRLPELLGQ